MNDVMARTATSAFSVTSAFSAAVGGVGGAGVNTFALVVEDDGTGFTMPDAVFDLEREGHLGVAGMSERAEAIGGTFAVDTRPGAGTRVLVTAPPSVFSTPIPA